MLPSVAIVLVNYNGVSDTLTCLESLKKMTYPKFEAIVVDNCSDGDDVAQIQDAYPDVTVIASEKNGGFSAGCNIGIHHAMENPKHHYIWLVNNDTTIDPKALEVLVKAAKTSPFGLFGSLILYPDGRFQRVGNHFESWRGVLKDYTLDDVRKHPQVDCLSACSMLIPREVIDVIGYWDESYFLYCEDNDYCLRAAQAGFPSRVVTESRVFHQEGASTHKNRVLVAYYYQRNRLRLAQRFLNPFQWRLVRWYTRFRLIRSTIKAGLSKDPEMQQRHRAFGLAVQDFDNGVDGPCPHNL